MIFSSRIVRKNFFEKFSRTFFCIFFAFLFVVTRAYAQSPDCEFSAIGSEISEGKITYALEMKLSEGWHPAKKPKIILKHSKNLKNFSYSDVGECEEISDQKYKVDFSFEKISDEKKFNADLEIQCPICRDICTIVTKHLKISDDDKNENFSQPQEEDFSKNFLLMLAFAFLGGLILNVMPCVLPVLLMKLRSFTYSKNHREALFGSLAGNYFVFCAFAISIFLLKKSGETVGWGMHFQNPIFLKFAAIALFFMSLQAAEIINLTPAFEIKNENKKIFVENFVSSIIAAFVALPCTAPFLGTAATFAIAEGTTTQFFTIFFAIATGFSLPYLSMLAVPESVSKNLNFSADRLQKFGKFFKQLINFGVYVAFLWIFWLLLGTYDILFKILVLLCFCFSFKFFQTGFTKAAAVLLIAIFLIPHKDSRNFPVAAQINLEDTIRRENSSENVFVLNISADWCMTCHFNKMMVLDASDVQKTLREQGVRILEADMTQKNDDYMKFIQKHARVGIPFTIVFGPAAHEGILLPEVFSKQQLYDAIKKAKSNTGNNI